MATDHESVQCRCTPVHETDWTERRRAPSMVIVDAVATAEGVDPMELTPLSGELDLEALDTLLLSSATNTCGLLGLHVAGWNVFVAGDGRIKVCEPSDAEPLVPVFEPVSAG